MKKNNYWQEREVIKDNIKRDKELTKEINKRLDQLMKDIEVEINRELQAYAKGQNIELDEVYQRINEMDVKAFQKKAKEYVKNKDFSATANYELKTYNRKMRINHLEWIKSMLGIELVDGFDDIEKILDEYFNDSAKRELIKQSGILGDTVMSNYSEVIEKVVNGSFHNASFSKKIWQYQNELKADLDKLLTRQMVNGHNPRKVASELRKSFDVTKFEAERLMRTESARIQGELQKSSYERLNVSEYDWVTEPSACSVCKGIASDGPYKVKDMKIGINMIPAHPNCRCSTVPVSDREMLKLEVKARDIFEKANKYEPKITNNMKDISSETGTRLEGLDFRLKTLESLTRKVKSEPNSKMRDVVRYTSVSTPENMVRDINKFVDELKSKGYTVSAMKNYWNNSSNPYNGVNTNFYSPDKYEFELQFHTPESFKLKNGKLHELYEKQRILDPIKDVEEISRINKEMFELSESLTVPKNIKKIGGAV